MGEWGGTFYLVNPGGDGGGVPGTSTLSQFNFFLFHTERQTLVKTFEFFHNSRLIR